MKGLPFFLKTPVSIQVLVLIYAFSIFKRADLLIRAETPQLVKALSGFEGILAIVLICFIIFKRPWTWKIGIAESMITATSSMTILFQGRHIIEHATLDAVQNDQAAAGLSQDQVELMMHIGFYSGIVFVALGAAVTGLLWYKSKNYFMLNT